MLDDLKTVSKVGQIAKKVTDRELWPFYTLC